MPSLADPGRNTVLAGRAQVMAPALELYLELHRDPELSGSERRTAARLAEALTRAGCDVTTGVGGHGVVGVLPNGPGPTVLLRAELDALPVEERTGLAYASRVTAPGPDGAPVPVMHACGHDLHTAALAGTARLLADARDAWRGTLVLVGQPAEETLTGAHAMLRDGLYDRFPVPDVALAQHVAPFPAGCVAHGTGPMTAYGTTLETVLHGRGGHAAMAHLTVNAVEIAAEAVLGIKKWAAAQRPDGTGRVTVVPGALHAGVRANVVPERARLSIGLRGLSPDRVDEAVTAVREILREVSRAAGSPLDPEVTAAPGAVLNVNSPGPARSVRAGHEELLGTRQVLDWPPSLAAEDFPLYGRAGAGVHGRPAVPTVYWMVGSVGPEQWRRAPGTTVPEKLATLPPNHSCGYAPDPVPTLRTAITALSGAALTFLTPEARTPRARRQEGCQRSASETEPPPPVPPGITGTGTSPPM
ncbi:amidohydrolase [Streptomyces lincolnensis]|uniref:amidohydrolase n=1 Tax=Streptomyces lincolnensis TaxID=1915 RepID=UPI0037D85F70